MFSNKKVRVALTILAVLLVITAIVVFVKTRKELKEVKEQAAILQIELGSYEEKKPVYILNQSISAGQEISATMFTVEYLPVALITDTYVTTEAEFKGGYFKVDMPPGNPLLLPDIGVDIITNQHRLMDIYVNQYPITLKDGDFIDLRLTTPYGSDYIVNSKLHVKAVHDDFITVLLDESEIHRYQAATVDVFINPGSVTYAAIYAESSIQPQAKTYYPVSQDVLNAMESDPNIVSIAESEVIQRRREIFDIDMAGHTNQNDNQSVETGRDAIVSAFRDNLEKYQEKQEGIIEGQEGEITYEGDFGVVEGTEGSVPVE